MIYFKIVNLNIFSGRPFVLLVMSLFSFQIRTLEMLRSRFQSLPGAFNDCLIPLDKKEKAKKKGLKAAFSKVDAS